MTLRILYQLARADFLERVRRYSFLITLALTLYFCYICVPPNHARYITLQIAGHRPIYNSAYIATLVALEATQILSFAGFYLVKNAIGRDEQTGVGQILAATRLSRPSYLLGKMMSNFAVLAIMVAVLAIAAGVMQIARHEDTAIHFWQLLAPFIFLVLPVMLMVASVAVLFEAVPFLAGGLGNLIYFVLWLGALASLFAVNRNGESLDVMGLGIVIPGIRSACDAVFPGCGSSNDFGMGFNFASAGVWTLTTFPWGGVNWRASIILDRLLWVCIAFGITSIAAVVFHRFDPSRESRRKIQPSEPEMVLEPASTPVSVTIASLSPAVRSFRFGDMARAELRIALKGLARWWYIIALGLWVGEIASPLAISRFWLIAAWIWPILIWSAMGNRETRQSTAQLIFSTAHPLRRQLPACWLAGFTVAAFTGSGTAIRLLIARDNAGLVAWIVGALFIPTLALALGVWSGSSKLFEVIYTLLWYVGPASQLPPFDFMGATATSYGANASSRFLIATLILVAFAIAGRKRQIRL